MTIVLLLIYINFFISIKALIKFFLPNLDIEKTLRFLKLLLTIIGLLSFFIFEEELFLSALYIQSIVSSFGDNSEFLLVSVSLFGFTIPTPGTTSEEPTMETPSSNTPLYNNETDINNTELENGLVSAIKPEDNHETFVYTEEDGVRLKKEAENLKEEILNLNKEESTNIVDIFNNQVNFFKNQSINADLKWESLKAKINQDVGVPKPNGFTNFEEINKVYAKLRPEIKEAIIQNKPLGDIGETTLNQIVDKGLDVLSSYPIPTAGEVTNGFGLISSYFLYKGVVNLFAKHAFKKDAPNTLQYQTMRAREIRLFMVVGAPLIVASLYTMKQVVFSNKIQINSESVSSNLPRVGDVAGAQQEITKNPGFNSLIPILGVFGKKLPGWLKSVILFIFSIIFVKYIYNYTGLSSSTILIVISKLKLVKLFFFLGSISSFILICYYIISIYLYIKFSEGKLNISIYLPSFILGWVKNIQEASKEENKSFYIEFYLRLIFVYMFILFLCLYILYLVHT